MKNKLKSLLKNKDNRTLIENFFSLSALQVVGLILPLITLPYVLRVVGFSNYGIIVLAASLIAYFQSVTDFSFKITATRDVAIFKHNQKKLNLIYSKVITIKAIFLLLSYLLITVIVLVYPPFREEMLVFFLSMPLLLGYALFPEWFFQGIEKMKYITFLNIGIKVFFTVCVFIFLKQKEDYWIYPFLQSAGFVGAGLVGQIILLRKYKLKFVFLKKRQIRNTIQENIPVFVNQFVPTLYNNTTTFLLGILTTTNLVGIYDAIKRIIDLAVKVINILSRVFFPLINRKKNVFENYRKLILIFTSILSIGILLIHPYLFWYLNIDYPDALLILIILVVGIIGFSLYDIFGLNYFIVKRNDKLVMKNTIRASLIGLVLVFPLISFFGIIGAAINLSFSRLIMGGGMWFKYFKMKKIYEHD
ncbi:oligosaccharide flippase family protein [Salegentibacter maritimus]|uniref:Oligosaccharide flippase family protein n=1 Tax=Salegentibacter maritimus TaxID=2794347 RepID=A0ABS0TEQ4_9FLAO|nr:oligosaccharide flippase family protein [Salegentibacter maritimus]MBI6119535.1 oligosaccharide flippase family protein [Salegentibacter maritimus]